MSNYDFLKSLLTTIPEDARNISMYSFALLLIVSIVMALLISHLYSKFFDANSTGSRIHRSFPLMGPAVTTIFITVQFSLPLSLGLLGALSIVRFRTPIKEPEEIGFILLVIACSISIATSNVAFAAILYLIVFISLHILKKMPSFNSSNPDKVILNVLIKNTSTKESMEKIAQIEQFFSDRKIAHIVTSMHVDEDKANASVTLKKAKNETLGFLSELYVENPDVQFDYYSR